MKEVIVEKSVLFAIMMMVFGAVAATGTSIEATTMHDVLFEGGMIFVHLLKGYAIAASAGVLFAVFCCFSSMIIFYLSLGVYTLGKTFWEHF